MPGLFSYALDGHMNRLLACAALLVAVAMAPAAALAHIGGESFIAVPISHVMPGETFPIVAADLGSGATISLRLVQGDHETDLGVEVAAPDGHFQTTRFLPADFPHGYAQLIANSDDGSEVSTFVLVGPLENAPPLPGGSTGEWWLDPSVLILAAILATGTVALAMVALRSARRPPAPTPVGERRAALRRSSGKARRRR